MEQHRRGGRVSAVGALAAVFALCGCEPTSERAVPDPAIPPKPKIEAMTPSPLLPALPTLR